MDANALDSNINNEEDIIDNSKKKCNKKICVSVSISIISFLCIIGFFLYYYAHIRPLINEKNDKIEELEKNIAFIMSSSFNNKIELIEKNIELIQNSSINKNIILNNIEEMIKNNEKMNKSLNKNINDLREENHAQKNSMDNNIEQLNNNFINKIGQIDNKIQDMENNYSPENLNPEIIKTVYKPFTCIYVLGGLDPEKIFGGTWMIIGCESLTNTNIDKNKINVMYQTAFPNEYAPNPFTLEKGLCLWVKLLN